MLHVFNVYISYKEMSVLSNNAALLNGTWHFEKETAVFLNGKKHVLQLCIRLGNILNVFLVNTKVYSLTNCML